MSEAMFKIRPRVKPTGSTNTGGSALAPSAHATVLNSS